MQGARWGWVAFIAAIAVLFVASSQDQSSHNKIATLLRQELKSTSADRDRMTTERNEAHETIDTLGSWAQTLDRELSQTQHDLLAIKAERDRLKKELASLSQDRTQLQQTVASLQLERSQTKRSVEQLRQGLHQLLNQTETVASQLTGPAPGLAQATFDDTALSPVPVVKQLPRKKETCEGTYYADEPLNDNQ